MSHASGLSIGELAQRCAEETDKFTHQLENDPQYCYELLRRALAERSGKAFTHVYNVYEPLVRSWVYRHSRWPLTGESADYFANAAFRAFYFGVSGPKFARFPTLAAALGYLKTCVHTTIAMYLRDSEPNLTIPIEDADDLSKAPNLGADAEAWEVWEHIQQLLPDEHDRLLARCAFVLGLRPQEIYAAYPQHWDSERSVSIRLYRIRQKLRGDPQLAALVGREPR